MIRIRDIALPVGQDESSLLYLASKALKLPAAEIASLRIFRRSLDARKKQELRWIYTLDITLKRGEGAFLRRNRNPKITREEAFFYQIPKKTAATRPVVVGFGPAGMFTALVLAEAGLRPIVLERGDPAPIRREKVDCFWNGGALDPESNVQFGEGGAGTFSDGKLSTGTKNERARWILEQLVRFGAGEDILYDAKPHVGTDILFRVVQNLRGHITALGAEVRFGAKLTGVQEEKGVLRGVEYEQAGEKKTLVCDALVLAIGHSARDTLRCLYAQGIAMEPKAFSMGVRIEHLQGDIDVSQYGRRSGDGLPPADYKLAVHLPEGAYTFCMCPGGYVVAAASQDGGVVTNGMSYSDRGGENANSALLVTLKPEDFPHEGALGGVQWQEALERRAFAVGGGDYRAPAQRLEDFLAHRPTVQFGKIQPTYRPGVMPCDLHDVLPEQLTDVLERAIPSMNEKLRGFANPDAVLTAPETRSSSPVRILRDESRQSALRGLYPCGEGAGYAGGIVSAAVDGVLCAEAILESV